MTPVEPAAGPEGGAREVAPVPQGQAARDVFVSYSSHDKPVADAIVSRLEQAGLRCWVAPRDILPGQVWGEAILWAIETTRLMVVVVSGASNGSRHVVREVERAVASDVVVIPFRIDAIEPTGAMAYFLASEHWLDAMTPPLEAHIAHLVEVVDALLGTMPGTAPRPAASVTAPTPPPPARSAARPRAIIAGVIGLTAVVAVGLVAALALTPPGPSAPSSSPVASSSSTAAPVEVTLAALVTGDCLLTPAPYGDDAATQVEFWRSPPGGMWPLSLPVVACDQPHGAEAYFVGDAWEADATYPGDAAVQSAWVARCAAELEAYIGVPASRSSLERNGWVPDPVDWEAGLREVACLAFDTRGADLLGSLKGTGR